VLFFNFGKDHNLQNLTALHLLCPDYPAPSFATDIDPGSGFYSFIIPVLTLLPEHKILLKKVTRTSALNASLSTPAFLRMMSSVDLITELTDIKTHQKRM
jgi:hypothetical protein